jgi:hypothetical protein
VVHEPANGGPALVTVTGGSLRYEAEVAIDRMVPVPECGLPLTESKKDSPEMVVCSLTPVTQSATHRHD